MLIICVLNIVMMMLKSGLTQQLHLCSFNAQRFGPKKANNTLVIETLGKLILQCDISLLQEVTDISGNATKLLLKHINSDAYGEDYDMVESKRLGRTNYKEQYVYFYRTKGLRLLTSFVYEDEDDDFERDPFTALFELLSEDNDEDDFGGVDRLAIVGVHIKPADAVAELSRLNEVIEQAETRTQTREVVAMGDFNAGCSFVKASDWSSIPLRMQPEFVWLIDNQEDTTSGASDCPYDRIVVKGDILPRAVDDERTGVFHLDEQYSLNSTQVKEISDHYPVHVTFDFDMI